ncbi:hypothetical protein SDC9_100554 [bioreactor metagenome]|uniref:Uncharacterized protein n=1 Tax=bioreactor metagenome TaxID=1076179 RepID=A0A645AKN7_9ZZZZ
MNNNYLNEVKGQNANSRKNGSGSNYSYSSMTNSTELNNFNSSSNQSYLNEVRKQNEKSRSNSSSLSNSYNSYNKSTDYNNGSSNYSSGSMSSSSSGTNSFTSASDEAYLQEVRRKNAESRKNDPTYQEMYSMFGMGEKKNSNNSMQ